MKIVISGASGTGKTTKSLELAKDLGIPVRHTDEFVGLPREEQHRRTAQLLDSDEDCIIEGVNVAGGLREWHRSHPGRRAPVDKLIVLTKPKRPITKGQRVQKKGIDTIHRQIRNWVDDVVEYDP